MEIIASEIYHKRTSGSTTLHLWHLVHRRIHHAANISPHCAQPRWLGKLLRKPLPTTIDRNRACSICDLPCIICMHVDVAIDSHNFRNPGLRMPRCYLFNNPMVSTHAAVWSFERNTAGILWVHGLYYRIRMPIFSSKIA